ncbi:MAG: sugar O-acetyltransferase [Planctomycetota bacterium]|nr:sugar O-acetyltransferase [Planctomycetota bacterium]
MVAKTEREKMLAGELYLGNDPELYAARARTRRLLQVYNASAIADNAQQQQLQREQLLKPLIGQLGRNVWIEPPFYCDYGTYISLGDNVYMNFNCIILDCNHVRLGNNVFLAPAVQIYAAYHPLNAAERIKGPENAAPVTIGDNVWIGGGAIILPGVTIGDNTTIGAGSVVAKSIPAGVLAVGNPCRVIRSV